jgi:LemA protein
MELQRELVRTEDRIQVARRFYNANVADYNRRVEAFPSNLLAGLFRFRLREYFEVEPAIRTAGPPEIQV